MAAQSGQGLHENPTSQADGAGQPSQDQAQPATSSHNLQAASGTSEPTVADQIANNPIHVNIESQDGPLDQEQEGPNSDYQPMDTTEEQPNDPVPNAPISVNPEAQETQAAPENGPDAEHLQNNPGSPRLLTVQGFQELRERELHATAKGWRPRGGRSKDGTQDGRQVLVQLGPRNAATFRLEPGAKARCPWNEASLPNIHDNRRGGDPDWPKDRLKRMFRGIRSVSWKVVDNDYPLHGIDPGLRSRLSRFTDCLVDIEWSDEARTWELRTHVRGLFPRGAIDADQAIFIQAVYQEDRYNQWLAGQRQGASVSPTPEPQDAAHVAARRQEARRRRNEPSPPPRRRRESRRASGRRAISDAPPSYHRYEEPEFDHERDRRPRQSASRSSRRTSARQSSRRTQEQEAEHESGSLGDSESESESESGSGSGYESEPRSTRLSTSNYQTRGPETSNGSHHRDRQRETRGSRRSSPRRRHENPVPRSENRHRVRQPETRSSHASSSTRPQERVNPYALATPAPTPERQERDDRPTQRNERAETPASGEPPVERSAREGSQIRYSNTRELAEALNNWQFGWLRAKGIPENQSLTPEQACEMTIAWTACLGAVR